MIYIIIILEGKRFIFYTCIKYNILFKKVEKVYNDVGINRIVLPRIR